MIYSDTIILAGNHLATFSIYAPRTPYKNFEFCGGGHIFTFLKVYVFQNGHKMPA